MTIILGEAEVAYFNAVFRRCGQADLAERRGAVFRDGSSPKPNDCHANAARMASEDPETTPVHGWLIEAGNDCYVRLAAHSLLRDRAGRLVEITPLGPCELRFIVHDGAAEAFFSLLPRFNQITWPPFSVLHEGVVDLGGAGLASV